MSKFVPYHAESVAFARELTRGMKEPLDRYKAITRFATQNIMYDYIRALTVPKKNGVPDVDRCWKLKMGICMDVAALVTGMLRAVGINAWMCFGRADRQAHAWVEASIGGVKYRYDHEGHAKVYKTERRFY